jgi:dihydroneopterin aldolase
MDRILINEIEFHGHCGVTAEERKVGQRLSVDVELQVDLRPASRHDTVSKTVNYAKVCQTVLEVGRSETCRLVETLAERIASALIDRFGVEELFLRVKKIQPPLEEIKGGVIVEIRRSRLDKN